MLCLVIGSAGGQVILTDHRGIFLCSDSGMGMSSAESGFSGSFGILPEPAVEIEFDHIVEIHRILSRVLPQNLANAGLYAVQGSALMKDRTRQLNAFKMMMPGKNCVHDKELWGRKGRCGTSSCSG